ncbi:uncharacterized protein IUM83_03320 [Phytophthora cinnamomi]|uniref:uncharacterized protein n=1 Tax=Phytophthora cinnamomi TaxID=4785 RepID=UPI0035594B76|nr:hypothetical protein IUM83_03320 [Phytophthora cinnamomi]
MATVRTTAPRGAEPSGGGANKRKRKRVGKSKEASPLSSSASSAGSSSVDAQLQTLENWHRALTVDLRELRREGARVRIELEKVDDTAEAAVERADRSAQTAQAAQEHARAAAKTAKDADARHAAELEKQAKRLQLLDKKLERQGRSSINEELLMTQLAELQEQYENELSKVREDHDAALEAKQKQLDALDKALARLQQDKKQRKQWEAVERALQALQEEKARLSQRLSQMPSRQEIQALQQQLQTLERENRDEQARTRTDLNSFEDKLVELDRRVNETDRSLADVDRKINDVGARAAPTRPPLPPSMPMPIPTPPPPRDLVRMKDLDGIHDALRRMSHDFNAVATDMASFSKRIDAQSARQEQHVETRLQELNSHVFDALGHDSRMHATEIMDSVVPQYGHFRLSIFGGKVIAHLWDHTLRKLPYAFFADWSWLDDQSTKEKLPALAFCHLLVSILLWNSAIDRHSLTNRNIYAAAVKHILPKLHVGGKPVYAAVGAAESSPLLLGECNTTHIEFRGLDTMFASMLGLDGFFEVTESLQSNVLVVTGLGQPASS